MSKKLINEGFQNRIFFRETEIDAIFSSPFRSRNIVAERKMGKTALLNLVSQPGTYQDSVERIKKVDPSYQPIVGDSGDFSQLIFIRVDMAKCRTPLIFLITVIERLIDLVGNFIIDDLMGVLGISSNSSTTVIANLIKSGDVALVYMLTDHQMRRIKTELDIYPFILIDRFDTVLDMPEFAHPDFFEYLAAWEEEFTLLIASITSVVRIREEVRVRTGDKWRASSDLGKSFGPDIYLNPFSLSQCVYFIKNQLYSRMSIKKTNLDINWIIDNSGRIPFFIILAFNYFSEAKIQGIETQAAKYITKQKILVSAGEDLFPGYWLRLSNQLDFVNPKLRKTLLTKSIINEVDEFRVQLQLIAKRTSLIKLDDNLMTFFSPIFEEYVNGVESKYEIAGTSSTLEVLQDQQQEIIQLKNEVKTYFGDCRIHFREHGFTWCRLDTSDAEQRLDAVLSKINRIETLISKLDSDTLETLNADIQEVYSIRRVLANYLQYSVNFFSDAAKKELNWIFRKNWPGKVERCYFLETLLLLNDKGKDLPDLNHFDSEKRRKLLGDE
jgi:hypothetical protein